MITRLSVFFRKIRILLSRSEWSIRLLDLATSEETAAKPGLILVQIDGLSHTQLNRALQAGKLPFLSNLLHKQNYRQHVLYSGMPSSTPAVQAELFYGIKNAVPSFSFKNLRSGQVMRMFDPSAASDVERSLTEKGISLLSSGSAYSDIFTGGADESHFCPSSLGWGDILRSANPLVLLILLLSNSYSLLRTAVLLVMEFFIAIIDGIRGIIDGRNLIKEMKFVPTRVLICILLRELITIGTKIDVARGLPIIHLNFIGYDEQAHRRGPSSKFAHWALKGIDDAIVRIWRAAQRSKRRQYDLWIYSDHGQEETRAYPLVYKRSIEEAVTAVFASKLSQHAEKPRFNGLQGIQFQRINLLGGRILQKLFGSKPVSLPVDPEEKITVTAMGPLGLIYVDIHKSKGKKFAASQQRRLAGALVRDASIPLVLVPEGIDEARAWTADGEFLLPRDGKEIFGSDHPFLKEVTIDFITLCHHHNGGDFIISGWRPDKPCITFPIENGSHAGPGVEETKAFFLAPDDISLPVNNFDSLKGTKKPGQEYLRPLDIRNAVFQHLKRPKSLRKKYANTPPVNSKTKGNFLRIMTYNVHACIGMDGKLSPERIARVIARHKPDIVALQELDVNRSRSGKVDQARTIARCLEMEYHFGPTVQLERGLYGNAILSRLPLQLVRAEKLPGLTNKPDIEPRGAIWCTVHVGEKKVQFVTTHLGLRPRERFNQAEALLGLDWLGDKRCNGPLIVCGDFNALPFWPVCRRLRERLRDVQLEMNNHTPKSTFSGRYPLARIDHVFIAGALTVQAIKVPNSELSILASDHRPLIVDIQIESD